MAARRWFCVGEEAVDIPTPGELCAHQGTASQPAKPVNASQGAGGSDVTRWFVQR